MGIPVPPPAAEDGAAAFVRTVGNLGFLPDDLDVTACEHTGLDGELVTEALVTGADALARVRRLLPDAAVVRPVREPEWVRQCILHAAGDDAAETAGALAVRALRAPEDEWHAVSHPGAPCAVHLLARLARCFDCMMLQDIV